MDRSRAWAFCQLLAWDIWNSVIFVASWLLPKNCTSSVWWNGGTSNNRRCRGPSRNWKNTWVCGRSSATRAARACRVLGRSSKGASRIVTGLQQAREGAKAVAARYDGHLRVAAGAALADLAAFFALCTQSCNACLGSPIRAATSTTVKPRLMTCLTASALNSAVYCLSLINTPVDAINYGHRDV